MTFRRKLTAALQEALAEEKALLAVLKDGQQETVGTFEDWTAKDHIAHAAEWAYRYAGIEAALQRGEETPAYGDEANREIFEKHRTASLEDVEGFAEKAQGSLIDQLSSLTDDELVAAIPGGDGSKRLRWKTFAGAGYIHVITHLDMAYLQLGDEANATRIEEQAAETLRAMDDSDDWNGRIHYNLACHYALSGATDRALSELRDALRLAPEITDWSKEDPDLESLREDPRYKALYD